MVLPHVATTAGTPRPCCSSNDAQLIAVWCNFGSCEIRVPGVMDYSIRIKVTVEVVGSAAGVVPAE